jgi:protein-S-isoprenylcysteine O-methyltransferase Ste14
MNEEPAMTSESDRRSLAITAASRYLAGLLVVGGLLFLPAGTLSYWQAWLYIGLLFVPVLIAGLIMFARDPAFLERRMRTQEQQPAQWWVVGGSTVILLAVYIVPGLDQRFGWSSVPTGVVFLVDGLILAGYALILATFRANRFASRVVEVEEEQSVTTTGPYAMVRHPMYLAMIVMFNLSPLALGSWWGLLAGLPFPLLLVGRIVNEERMLRQDLAGYAGYCSVVKYRLIPYVW